MNAFLAVATVLLISLTTVPQITAQEQLNCDNPQDLQGGVNCVEQDIVSNDPALQNQSVILLLINVILFALALVAVVGLAFLIWGGFRYITSLGDEEATKKAKATILYAIIGILIVGISFSIIQAVYTFMSA